MRVEPPRAVMMVMVVVMMVIITTLIAPILCLHHARLGSRKIISGVEPRGGVRNGFEQIGISGRLRDRRRKSGWGGQGCGGNGHCRGA